MRRTHFLLILLLFAFVLRAYDMGVPFSGHHAWKEVQFAGMAYKFMESGDLLTPRNFHMGPHNNVLPLPAWLVMISWTLFGVSEWAARLPFILAGVGSVYLLYKIGTVLYNERVGLLSAFFLCLAPMHIYFSRNVQPESLLIFLMLGSAYYFVVWAKTEQDVYLYVSAAILSIALVVKPIAAFILLPYCGYAYLKKVKLPKEMSVFFFLAVIVSPACLWFDHVGQFEEQVWSGNSFSMPKDLLNLGYYKLKAIEFAYGTNPLVLALGIPLLIRIKYDSDAFIHLWVVAGIVYLAATIPISGPNNYYILPVIPALCIAGAAGYDRLNLKRKHFILPLIFIVSIGLAYALFSVRYPYYEAGNYLKDTMQPGDTLGWVESPAVCYYAKRDCRSVNTLEEFKAYDPTYIAIPSTFMINALDEWDFGTKLKKGEFGYIDFLFGNYQYVEVFFGKQNMYDREFSRKENKEFVDIWKKMEGI